MIEIIPRMEAKEAGLKWYFTGKPCKNGHIAERQTSSRVCRECNKSRSKKAYHANRESRVDYRRKYREENREEVNQAQRKYYNKNREQCNQNSRDYYHKNKYKLHKAAKKWREENKHIRAALNAKRRARKLNATPKWLTPEDHQVIQELYTKSRTLTESTGIPHEIDHILPLQGEFVSGLHVPSNLQILTAAENASKKNSFDPSAAPPGATLH